MKRVLPKSTLRRRYMVNGIDLATGELIVYDMPESQYLAFEKYLCDKPLGFFARLRQRIKKGWLLVKSALVR